MVNNKSGMHLMVVKESLKVQHCAIKLVPTLTNLPCKKTEKSQCLFLIW